MFLSFLQFRKARDWISVTVIGKVTVSRFGQEDKQQIEINVVPFGNEKLIKLFIYANA